MRPLRILVRLHRLSSVADLQRAIEAQRGERTERARQQVEADVGQAEMRGQAERHQRRETRADQQRHV